MNQVTDFDLDDRSRGLARWQVRVCPLVSGLPRAYGEFILERVTQIAQQAGAPLAGRYCRPNLYILVTKQPQPLLLDLAKRHLDVVFGGADPQAIGAFIAESKPVKTWYNTVRRTAEGLPMQHMSFPGNQSMKQGPNLPPYAVRAPGLGDDITTNPWSQASRLTFNEVWAIYEVFVVVDPTRFKTVSLGQLADYVSMVGLAQIKLDAALGHVPSILTLWDMGPEAASPGLTAWDRAFLKAVYATEQKSIVQRSAIARGMVHDLVP